MLMLDLCSGLGGASAAMVARGWKVITVDNNPVFNPSVIVDIRIWQYSGPRPDLIWCSPPCNEFSRSFLPWIKDKGQPDLSIVLACKLIIELASPRFWIIENVKGAMSWFDPVLGYPAYVCNPFYLWDRFPDISYLKLKSNKEKLSSDRAALRAKIPFKLSYALAYHIENSINSLLQY
jgi:site-specific DNA-cytosine methylase